MLKRLRELGVMVLSDDESPCLVDEWISTGSIVLDKIIGNGLPIGRLTELFGDPSTGKSLIAAQVAAVAQSDFDATVVYVDTETAVSKAMMEIVGVDTDKLLYASPDTVEEVFTIFDEAIEAKIEEDPDGILLLIWDSIAATSIQMEMEGAYGKATMGTHARLISQGLRKITRKISKERVCMLVLNQTRTKVGVMYGDSTTTFGGKAVHFHASVRIHLHEGKKIIEDKSVVGIMTKAVVVKNKVNKPFMEAILPIYFDLGIYDCEALYMYMKRYKVFEQSGSWYILTLDGKEHKFQKSSWANIYDKYADEIEDMVLDDSNN